MGGGGRQYMLCKIGKRMFHSLTILILKDCPYISLDLSLLHFNKVKNSIKWCISVNKDYFIYLMKWRLMRYSIWSSLFVKVSFSCYPEWKELT